MTKGMTEGKTWLFELDISGGSSKSRLISQFPLQPTKDGGLCFDQGVKSINPTAACCRRLGVRPLPAHCGGFFLEMEDATLGKYTAFCVFFYNEVSFGFRSRPTEA